MEVKCEFRAIPEYSCLNPEGKKTKLGRYHGSRFSNVNHEQYPIAAYIDGNISQLRKKEKMTAEQIVDAFLLQLNVPTIKRKKEIFTYGLLTKHSQEYKIDPDGKEYIVVILLTNDKKNKNFWGEGTDCYEQYRETRPGKKRGRKPKERAGSDSDDQLSSSRVQDSTGTDETVE